jgi:MFS family permease
MVGLLIGGSSLIQMILDVPGGYLLDRFGYTRILRVSTFLFFLGAAFLLFGLHPWTYVLTLVGAAAGWLIFEPGIDAYILAMAPKKYAGKFIAMRDIIGSAGIVAGMIVLSFIVHLDAPVLALIVSSIFFMSLIALWRTPKERRSALAEKKIPHQSFYIRRHFIQHTFQTIKKFNPVSTLLLLSGFSGAVFYGTIWFVVPLLIARTINSSTLSAGLIIFDGSVLVVGFLIGRLTERWSKRWLVFWGLLLFSIMAFLLGFNFGILFVIFGFLATTGDEMASISLWTWLDHLDKEHTEDGLLAGAIHLAEDVGWTVGPMMAGFLFQFLGPSWTLVVGAGFIFATWIASVIITHTLPHPPKLLPILLHIPRRRRHNQ